MSSVLEWIAKFLRNPLSGANRAPHGFCQGHARLTHTFAPSLSKARAEQTWPIAFTIVAILALPVAGLFLELGAVAQYYPRPAMQRVIAVLPLMIVGSIGNTVWYLLFHGMVVLPAGTLLGLLNAGIGKLILWRERE